MNISIEFVVYVLWFAVIAGFWFFHIRMRKTMNILVMAREEAAVLHANRLRVERQMRLNLASSVCDVSVVIEEYLETGRHQNSASPEEAESVLETVAEGLERIALEASDFR